MTPGAGTADLLAALHAALGEGLVATQYALMDRRPDQALAALDTFEAALLGHMGVEETLLFPTWAEAVPAPPRGGDPDLFAAEHEKIRGLTRALRAALAEAGPGPVGHAAALALLERVHPLKNLLQHHELREERILAPTLDEVLGEGAEALRRRLSLAFGAP